MKFLIDFNQTATTEQINLYCQNNSLTIVSTYNEFDKVYLVSASVTPPVTEIVETVIQDEDNPINLVSYPINEGDKFAKVQFETELDLNWWKVAVQAMPDYTKETQTVERRGQNAIVYVVDSGIKMDHPEFEFSTVSNLYSFNSDFTDYNGHGTAIASLLCGKTCAISDPIVKSVKIFQSGVNTLRSNLVAAFDAILSDVDANTNKFHVVNLSWSIPRDLYLESKIRLLVDRGVWVVAAAGNSGTTIEDITPACMPEVFTVGAFGTNLEPCNFSNYTGPIVTTNGVVNTGELDVWAPGNEIRIATIDGNYATAGGTSLAAAIQSAAIAYNCNNYCYDNGGVPEGNLNTRRFLNSLSIGKPNLIIKDDKYVQSSNFMTQFLTEYDGENGTYAPLGGQSLLIGSNDEYNFYFGPSTLIQDISLADPLPNGLRLEGRWLRGQITVSEQTEFQSAITYTSPSGAVYTKTLRIILVPVSVYSTEFNFDEVVKVTPLINCGDPTDYFCGGICAFGGPCLDACDGGKGPIPGFTQCYCGPVQQACQ